MPYFDQYGPDFDSGGQNAARDFERYRQSDDFRRSPPAGWDAGGNQTSNPFAFLGRLFGGQKGQITGQPLPPPGQDPTNPGHGPFGYASLDPAQQQPPVPQPKPTTQLASSNEIMKRISQMIGGPQETAPPDWSSFFPWTGGLPQLKPAWAGDAQTQNFSAAQPPRGPGMPNNLNQAVANSPFDVLNMGPPRPRQRVMMRAAGGEVPGFMRGGYPELYNRPIRHFDSGGESYVGNDYGDANGRADNINARLSPKEYVVDAETMALLGDGNPDDGAKKMDEMRENIRKQKGKNLAKGKISPKAKAASSYIAGNPAGDGMRRLGLKT